MVEGRCMKCREQKVMKDAVQGKMANGRDCVKGVCPTCGTKMFKIGTMAPIKKTAESPKKK